MTAITDVELDEIEEGARLDGNYRARQLVREVRAYKALLRGSVEELRWIRQALLGVDWSWSRAEDAIDRLIEAAREGEE